MKTIRELKRKYIDILNKKNIDESQTILNNIFEYVLNMSKTEILAYDNTKVNVFQFFKIKTYINMIIKGIPIQYITHKKEFMGLEMFVNSNVLVPRNDTEILVDNCIRIIQKISEEKTQINILDMCTGSGCITVSILKYFKDNDEILFKKLHFTSVDISKQALKIAKINIKKYNLNDKVSVINSDIFKNVQIKEYDLVISNPPYIETDVISKLDENVKNEPYIALDGGKDGLFFYHKITEKLDIFLKKDGYICYEIGYNEAQSVSDILKKNGFNYEIIKDLSQNDRVIIGNR